MNKEQQKEFVVRIVEGKEPLVIPIRDDSGTNIGTMRPITKTHLQSNDVIEKMTNWRNQYRAFFLSQFKATPARTKQWLEKVVLTNPSQLLFLIYHGETLIGQYGFKDLDGDSAFLDNLLRGERGGHPMLMKYAVSALADWLFDTMQVNMVYGYTFANNAMALKLNKDVGFTCVEKLPLQKQVVEDEIKWVVGKAGEPSPDNHYYQKIVMKRDANRIRSLNMHAKLKSLVDLNRIELHKAIPLESPLVLYVEISGFCNLKCKFCVHHTSPGDLVKHNMTFDIFKKMVDDMKSFKGIKLLRYCGTGESLLNKELLNMMKYARKSNVSDRAELITNGVLLNEEYAKNLPKYLDRIIISIEGLNDRDYMEFAGTKVTFDNVVKNISVLYKNRGDCTVHVKIHNHAANNKDNIDKFLSCFGNICDEIYVENLVSLWPEVKSNLGVEAGYRYGGDVVPRKVCAQIFKSMLVQANGEVVPCCVDYKRVNIIGNIKNQTLSEIWNSKAMRELRIRHLRGLKSDTRPCSGCVMNDYTDPDNIDDYADEILKRYV